MHGRIRSKDVLIVMQKRKVIRSERRVRSLEKGCKGRMGERAMFNV